MLVCIFGYLLFGYTVLILSSWCLEIPAYSIELSEIKLNGTQWHSIHGLSSIEFGNRTQSNELSSIGFDCPIFVCEFDFIRLLNLIELNPWIGFDRVRLSLIEIQFDWVRLTMLGEIEARFPASQKTIGLYRL